MDTSKQECLLAQDPAPAVQHHFGVDWRTWMIGFSWDFDDDGHKAQGVQIGPFFWRRDVF